MTKKRKNLIITLIEINYELLIPKYTKMKNFIIALVLTVGYFTVCACFPNVICVQIFSFLWIVIYALGMDKMEGQFCDAQNNLKMGKFWWNGFVCRAIPSVVFIVFVCYAMWIYEFLFSLLIFAVLAAINIGRVIHEFYKLVDDDDDK